MPVLIRPFHQTVNLDVVGFVAPLITARRIARHVGEAINHALERHIALRNIEGERNMPHRAQALAVIADRIGETGCAHPFLHDPFQVDVGGDHPLIVGKSPGFCQQFAEFIDQCVSVPCQISGRLAWTGG